MFEFLQTHFVEGQITDSESDTECDTVQNENVDGGTKHLLRLAQTEQVDNAKFVDYFWTFYTVRFRPKISKMTS